jgi:Response regulator containing CheY-like receiver, AAA-type ATPase, and DNA-binding domains
MRIAKEALERLRGYTWPGNVRELDNEIERAVALAYGDTITMTDLSDPLQQQTTLPAAGGKSLLKDSEKQLIEQALKEAKGNKTQAAERLGMSREGLRKKLKRLGME